MFRGAFQMSSAVNANYIDFRQLAMYFSLWKYTNIYKNISRVNTFFNIQKLFVQSCQGFFIAEREIDLAVTKMADRLGGLSACSQRQFVNIALRRDSISSIFKP